MNKKGQITIGILVLMLVGIIVTLAMLPEIANTQSKVTSKQPVSNETINLMTSGCYNAIGHVNQSKLECNITVTNWVANDWRDLNGCDIGSVTVTNSTGTILTLDTDYNLFATNGFIKMLNTTFTSNVSTGGVRDNQIYLNYNYCDTGYNQDSGARGIAGLWTVFAVLIIFAFVIAYGLKNEWFNF